MTKLPQSVTNVALMFVLLDTLLYVAFWRGIILIREKDFVQEKVPLNATTTRDYNIGVNGLGGCIGALQSIPLSTSSPFTVKQNFRKFTFAWKFPEIFGNFRKR
jgi:hypothetical protein